MQVKDTSTYFNHSIGFYIQSYKVSLIVKKIFVSIAHAAAAAADDDC